MIGGFLVYIILFDLFYKDVFFLMINYNLVFRNSHQEKVGVYRCFMLSRHGVRANIDVEKILSGKYMPQKGLAFGIETAKYVRKHFMNDTVPAGFF